MKNNLKILLFLLFSAMFFSCSSAIPRAMGPYIEAGAQNLSKNQNQTQTQAQVQPQQQQTKPQQQQTQPQQQTKPQPQQTPQTQPQQTQTQQNYDVRNDVFVAVSASDVSRIKTYNIIVGSFSVKENALNLAKSLSANYNPIVIVNEKGMYRVIIASFDSYDAARDEMNKSIKHKFPDAWLLTQKK